MTRSSAREEARRWGFGGIVATLIVGVVFYFLGLWTSILISDKAREKAQIDAAREYANEIIQNAINELQYNNSLSWYNYERYVASPQYFPALRTTALWTAYYNRFQVFGDDTLSASMVLECINEIDWVNRMVPAQYTPETVALMRAVTRSGDFDSKAFADALPNIFLPIMVTIHGEMFRYYNKEVKPRMQNVMESLVRLQAELKGNR